MKHVCSKYNDTLSNVKKILEEYHAVQIQLKITIQFLKSSISPYNLVFYFYCCTFFRNTLNNSTFIIKKTVVHSCEKQINVGIRVTAFLN